MHFERYIIQEKVKEDNCCQNSICKSNVLVEVNTDSSKEMIPPRKKVRLKLIWRIAWLEYKKLALYLFVGIAIGSIIYGFIPTEFLANYASDDNPFAIPIAAIIGIPLYVRAETVIPLAAGLLAKGVGAGTVLALIIGSAGASITELILLKSIFRIQLLIAFVAVILGMALLAGYCASILS